MKTLRYRMFFNTITFKLFSIILTIVTLLILLYTYNNIQSRNILLRQILSTHENMLGSFLNQIENEMRNSMQYTIDLTLFETDPQLIAYHSEEAEAQYAKQRLLNNMNEKIITNRLIDGYFFITYNTNGDANFIMSNQSNISTVERRAVREYVLSITNSIDDNLFSGDMNWKTASINNADCLVQVAAYKDDIYVGAYIGMNHLISKFDFTNDIGSELLCIPDHQIENLSTNGILKVTQASSLAPFSLIELIPSNVIPRSLPFMQKYMVIISAFCVTFLPILIIFLRRIVIKPLQILTNAMNHIHKGDLDYRIPPYDTTNELTLVNNTFNEMIDQVQNLKIAVYEEKIKVQRSQLRNLQLQINPHFLINSLNSVYNLIKNEDYDTADKLIRYSVDYFRYMVKVDEDFVPLNEEVEHVKAFLQIQSIRYKDKFSYSIDVDQQIFDMLIPPVLIQSFVENSMKYAIRMSDPVHIAISVKAFEVNYYPYATIIISDTGPGYPQEYLPILNQGKKIIDSNGDHIGIRNAVQRLSILFGGQATWNFYNNNGAVSEIVLPATFGVSE